jgi:hypothetical protein
VAQHFFDGLSDGGEKLFQLRRFFNQPGTLEMRAVLVAAGAGRGNDGDRYVGTFANLGASLSFMRT